MVKNASAMLAKGRAGALPAHIVEGVFLEPQQLGGFGDGEEG